MKKDDLTRLKHIGPSRMKILNDFGITTIEQLSEIPLKKLAEVTSIGEYYAKLIKNAVAEYSNEEGERPPGKPRPATGKPVDKINKKLGKKIAALNKKLHRLDDELKPLWKKKYVKPYVDFKKKTKQLKEHFDTLTDPATETLSKKAKKNIIKKADALESILKRTGKKPKKKKYKEITLEIQSFYRMLRGIMP